MIKVNIGGMNTKEIKDLVEKFAEGKIEVKITSDISGVQEVLKGDADYYLGACATGGGDQLLLLVENGGFDKSNSQTSRHDPRGGTQTRFLDRTEEVGFHLDGGKTVLIVERSSKGEPHAGIGQ